MERLPSQHASTILLAEDNPVDAHLILLALEEEKDWLTELVVAEDGEKAIEYLTTGPLSPDARRPDLVILDLNLPKKDGTEVLHVIRTAEGLRTLPVIVVSSSPEEISEGIVRQANLEANGYIMKPSSVDEFLALGAVFRKILLQIMQESPQNSANDTRKINECNSKSDPQTAFGLGSQFRIRQMIARA